jgi:D-serine deaminase-like pyridoxal phosphate-dependent protein
MPALTDRDLTIVAPSLPPGLDTPAVVVDLDRVEANLAGMQRRLDERGVALRPHTKTHKSVRFAALQRDAGAVGLTVAVLSEAQLFADAGFDDVFVAYPVWAGGPKAARLRGLHERIRLTVGVDSVEGAVALGRALEGADRPLRVLVEIDSGELRTGVAPDGALPVAQAAADAGLDVAGVFTHGGHSYRGPQRVADAAADETDTLHRSVAALRGAGFAVDTVSAGSTPTALRSATGPVTEERPGTYIFGDRQQTNLGGADPASIALAVATTVVSTASGARQCVIDAGAKSLAKDRPGWLDGHGVIPGLPGAVITSVYDHHGIVALPDGVPVPDVGEQFAVVPNHVCPVVNLSDDLIITRDGGQVDVWPVDGRGLRA